MPQLDSFTESTATSPAAETSLSTKSRCNPPTSSDFAGLSNPLRVQSPLSPQCDSKYLILRGSQSKTNVFCLLSAWPTAPLKLLSTAAVVAHSLSLCRAGLCRQASHLCHIFHPKIPDEPFPITQNSQEKMKQAQTSSS